MSRSEDQLKKALTSPSPGLRTVGPGLFVSTRSVKEIVQKLVKAGKIERSLPT